MVFRGQTQKILFSSNKHTPKIVGERKKTIKPSPNTKLTTYMWGFVWVILNNKSGCMNGEETVHLMLSILKISSLFLEAPFSILMLSSRSPSITPCSQYVLLRKASPWHARFISWNKFWMGSKLSSKILAPLSSRIEWLPLVKEEYQKYGWWTVWNSILKIN